MNSAVYIYQQREWPRFTWDDSRIVSLLGQVRNAQGRMLGEMNAMGFDVQNNALLESHQAEIISSFTIEGELLNKEEVRSSLARHLGMVDQQTVQVSRDIDAVVAMMLDASQFFKQPITAERLFGWHAALFPTGYSGMHKITTGNWRVDDKGPMQVVSGALGKQKIHFEAPHALEVSKQMRYFLEWLNSPSNTDPVINAAIAHLWFLTVHPFDDGNGRIARAITDLMLARSDDSSLRFYSLSKQILEEKKAYYANLESSQKGTMDITNWITWFLGCLHRSIETARHTLKDVLNKASFWKQHQSQSLNSRQKYMVNKLFDDFFGKLNTSKWAKMNKCSRDTAFRDIQDLVQKDMLQKDEGGGRSTTYSLKLIPD